MARGGAPARLLGRVVGSHWTVAVLVFATTAVVFSAPGLLPGRGMGGFDLIANTTPYRDTVPETVPVNNPLQSDQLEQLPLVAEFWSSARAGDLQLWEPDHAAGIPLATAVYNRVLAPPNLAYAVVPGYRGAGLAVVLALFLAQLGSYALARRLGLGRAGALLAGVAYGFSGPVTALLLRIHETAMLPWVLAGVHAAFTSPRRRTAIALTAAATAGTLLSGFPAASLHVLYLAVAFGLWLLVDRWRRRGRRDALAGLLRCSTGAVAGGLLTAPVLLPSAEWLASSSGLARSYDITHALGLDRLATAVSGRFFGVPQDGDFRLAGQGLANPVEASMTMGVVVLLLLAWLVWSPPRRAATDRSLRGFLVPAGAVVGVAVVLGGPVLGLVHQLPFMASNSFGRARFIISLVVAVTAGVGLDGLLRHLRARAPAGQGARSVAPGRPDRVLRWWAAGVLALVGVGTYLALSQAAVDGALGAVARDLAVPVLAGAAVTGAALAAWRLAGRGRTDRRAPQLVAAVALLGLVVELQAGAWGVISSAPRELFYPRPELPAAMADDVGPEGAYRFTTTSYNVLTPHHAGLLDLTDLRVAFPSSGPWRDLMEVADPGVFSRLRTIGSHDADWTSPVLDRLATRYIAHPLHSPPIETVPAEATSELDDELGFTLPELPAPLRGVATQLDTGGCRRGWVELRAGTEVLSRRPAREVRDTTVFPVVDLDAAGTAVRVVGTDCTPTAAAPTVSYLLASGPTRVLTNDGILVYERPDARPRVDVAEDVVLVPPEEAAAMAGRLPATIAVVSSDLGVDRGASASVTADLHDPDRLHVEVDADGRVLLVLRDVLDPGWSVALDGEQVDPVVVDHALRGVVVPDGDHVVVARYWPRTLTLGLWLAGLGALLLAAALAAPTRRE